MRKSTRDLAALGANVMSTRDLLAIAGVRHDEADAAERALSLVGAAREAALAGLKSGPRLTAAVELGRRAWMLPSPAGRRVCAPVDVAAICAPRFTSEHSRSITLALDRRMTVARITSADAVPAPALLLRDTLSSGVMRAVVCINRRGAPAVPTNADVQLAETLVEACALVDMILVDVVILGDDGFSSLRRLGLTGGGGDQRYR